MRIVVDANVLVSAMISSTGTPARVISYWQEEQFELVMSPAILQELDRVLHYSRIQQRYHPVEKRIRRLLRLLERQAVSVVPAHELTAIEHDPADNRYLECAVEGEAAVIVTRDQHLLEMGEYEGSQILTPAAFLVFLELENEGI